MSGLGRKFATAPALRTAPRLILALDTGGTNTDAVIYDPLEGAVLAAAKAFTTHHDLALGLAGAIEGLAKQIDLQSLPIRSVNLSTTLATNAIAEGQGHRAGLVMIGFDRRQALVQELLGKLPSVSPIFVDGGHDYYGREEAPLDEAALTAQVDRVSPGVAAWAVAGFFSVKNPAHEMRAAELIAARHPQPVTLGRSLSGELGAMRRAATAALNAGLVLIIRRLLDAVGQVLRDLGLNAPIMVVKGDGGLVGEDWARAKPIETVVSGPAAGLVGALRLAGGFLAPEEKSLWVLDVGGTTSDLAYLRDGRPGIDSNGAKVGAWRTMVEAVETATRGLGGDSLTEVSALGEISLGPRRALPLCRLAEKWPHVEGLMSSSGADAGKAAEDLLTFFLPNLPPGPEMGEDETAIVKLLKASTPLQSAEYQRLRLAEGRFFPGLKVLTHPAVLISGFTPTDAMNVLGLFRTGAPSASRLAATILGRRCGWSAQELCRRLLDEFGRLLAEEIFALALSRDGTRFGSEDFRPDGLLGRALSPAPGLAMSVELRLHDPVILLGAPAAVLAPWTARRLKAKVLAPPNCQVASAVGAAASKIALTRKVDVVSLPDFSGYRAFLPDRLMDDPSLESLIGRATTFMEKYMAELAALAGADEKSPASCERVDREARLGDGARLIMGASLTFRVEEAR
ncbi:MAG: hydantoinase/oxoprolinase family protein [Deltaproteobacteria bacterium]|jgi:N-methylhydantoinase A/oxoprolinase/acetone carboxylase beta subunit|nr:hydantoinase/oxoprolinase family protein [Deltaproteobacteria bacterium]